jgi:Coenzyme PQQ synthesis protein D (PqqD)
MSSILRRPIDFIRDRKLRGLMGSKPPSIYGKSIFERNSAIIAVELRGGQTVLFHTEKRTSILLNETAHQVFAATNGKLDVNGISKVICKKYSADFKIVFKDVKQIYKEFFRKGVVINGR